MRLALWALLVLSVGCKQQNSDVSPVMVVTYRVLQGDTLQSVASKRSCTVDQLREWNRLATDELTPGQILEIHRGESSGPLAAGGHSKDGGRHVRQGELVDPGDAPVVRVSVTAALGDDDDGGLGLLGAFDAASQALSGKIDGGSSSARPVSTIGAGGLGNRGSLEAGGSAESLDVSARPSAPAPSGPVVGSAPVAAPKLPRPAAKQCLAGPSADAIGDDDMVASQGLTVDEIRGGMRAPVQASLQCLPPGTHGKFQVIVSVTAGCNGLVSEATVDDPGGLPKPVTDCITATVAQAGFPAHDLPDGATFLYPIRFAFE